MRCNQSGIRLADEPALTPRLVVADEPAWLADEPAAAAGPSSRNFPTQRPLLPLPFGEDLCRSGISSRRSGRSSRTGVSEFGVSGDSGGDGVFNGCSGGGLGGLRGRGGGVGGLRGRGGGVGGCSGERRRPGDVDGVLNGRRGPRSRGGGCDDMRGTLG